MRNTITKLMQDLDFQRLIHNAGIEPAPLFDIDVKDAEVVKPNNETAFRSWFFNIGGNLNFTDEQITNGYQNHTEKWKH